MDRLGPVIAVGGILGLLVYLEHDSSSRRRRNELRRRLGLEAPEGPRRPVSARLLIREIPDMSTDPAALPPAETPCIGLNIRFDLSAQMMAEAAVLHRLILSLGQALARHVQRSGGTIRISTMDTRVLLMSEGGDHATILSLDFDVALRAYYSWLMTYFITEQAPDADDGYGLDEDD